MYLKVKHVFLINFQVAKPQSKSKPIHNADILLKQLNVTLSVIGILVREQLSFYFFCQNINIVEWTYILVWLGLQSYCAFYIVPNCLKNDMSSLKSIKQIPFLDQRIEISVTDGRMGVQTNPNYKKASLLAIRKESLLIIWQLQFILFVNMQQKIL